MLSAFSALKNLIGSPVGGANVAHFTVFNVNIIILANVYKQDWNSNSSLLEILIKM